MPWRQIPESGLRQAEPSGMQCYGARTLTNGADRLPLQGAQCELQAQASSLLP